MVATRATEDNESDEATSNAHLAFPGHSHSYIPSMPSWFSSSTAAHVSFPSAAPRSRKSSQELRGLESTRSSKQQRRFPKASPRGRLQYGPRSTTGPSVGGRDGISCCHFHFRGPQERLACRDMVPLAGRGEPMDRAGVLVCPLGKHASAACRASAFWTGEAGCPALGMETHAVGGSLSRLS